MDKRKNNLSLKRLVCFISAPASTDLHTITRILSRRNVRVVIASSAISTAKSLHDSITTAISKADFVIAVLNDSNDFVFYEIGYASAIEKEIIIIASKSQNIPLELESRFVVRTDTNNIKAIEFAVEQVLTRIEMVDLKRPTFDSVRSIRISDDISAPSVQTRKRESDSHKRIPKYHSLGKGADKYLDRLMGLGDQVTNHELAVIICEALEESGISILARSSDIEKSADIAVWTDEFKSLSNPILIEIKTHIRDNQQADTISKQISEYMTQSQSRFALVLFYKGITRKHYMHPWLESYIYFMNAYDFIDLLRTNSFGRILRNIVQERYSEDDH